MSTQSWFPQLIPVPAYRLGMTYQDDAFLSSTFTPRAFFFPHVDDPEQAERVYLGASKNLHGESVSEWRIQRLDYIHDGRRFRAEVVSMTSGGKALS